MLRSYEGMFVIRPERELEGSNGVLTKLQEVISKNGGTIESSQNWGKRRLSYKIGNCVEGTYWLANFRMSSDAIDKLKQAVKLNDAVLRMLVLAKQKAVIKK